MAIRNFWLEANIDGRKTPLQGGPRAKDGGMTATLYIRNDGAIEEAVTLDCHANKDGALVVLVEVEGRDVKVIERQR